VVVKFIGEFYYSFICGVEVRIYFMIQSKSPNHLSKLIGLLIYLLVVHYIK